MLSPRLTAAVAVAALAATFPAPRAAAQQPVTPLAIEDAMGAAALQPLAELGAISPDGALVAYAACDPRRTASDSASQESLTANSALHTRGCELRVSNLADGATRTVAASERGGHWGPAWSPDGQRLAFYSDRDGVARVWLWERASGKLRRISDAETRTSFAYERPHWLPDGRALLVQLFTTGVPRSTSNVQEYRMAPPPDTVPGSTLRLYRSAPPAPAADSAAARPPGSASGWPKTMDFAVMDVASGRVRRLQTRIHARWHQLSPDGRWLAWAGPGDVKYPAEPSARLELRLLELATGRERTLATGIGQQWDRSFTWSPDSRYLAYTSWPSPGAAQSRGSETIDTPTGGRGTGDSELFVVAVDGGAPRRFSVPTGDGMVAASDWVGPLWSASSDAIVIPGQGRLWRGDVGSGSLAEVQMTGAGAATVREIVRAADHRRYWSPAGDASLAVVTTDSATRTSAFVAVDLRTGAARELVRRQESWGRGAETAMVSPRGDAVVYLMESASASPDLWIADAAFAAPRRLTTLNPQLARYAFGTSRLVEYRGADGTPLRASLLLPAGYEPGTRYPLAVWVYASGQGSRSLNTFGLVGVPAFNMHMLTTRGYAVLHPDIPVQVGTPMQDLMKAVMPALDKVIELGVADPERLAVMGQSNGGYSTLALLAQTERFKAGVMNAGFGDLTGFYGSMNPMDGTGGWHPWLEQYGGAMGVAPWEAPLRYVENSPVYYLDRVRTPLLIQAGGDDSGIVPFSDQVFVGLKRLARDVTYLRYDREGHVLAHYPNLVDYWQRVIAFLDDKVKGAGAAATSTGAP